MTTGLAWFARQIPSEGFSDIGEGRVGEKEIPHSDQWIAPPEKDSDTYRPDRFNRKSVIKGRNKGGFSTLLIEELYQSKEYLINKGAHGATLENGKYVFQYPPAFQNSSSVNKSISVRRIDTKPLGYYIDFVLTIWTEDEEFTEDHKVQVQIPYHYGIQEAGSAIKICIDRQLGTNFAAVETLFSYNPDTFEVQFGMISKANRTCTQNYQIDKQSNDDLLKILNFPIERAAEFYAVKHSQILTFKNVRSREPQDIFLHASFVPNTTAGYLGRGGEFYPKPSKTYSDDGQNFFYIETSLDGYNRVSLPYENFILELIFILDSDNYENP
jgi:hypothetical protein